MDYSRLFQAISDEKRRHILVHLEARDHCVKELVEHFHLSQSSISKHLTVLKNAGLVKDRRSGQNVIYSLDHDNLKSCCTDFFKRFACCHSLFDGKTKKEDEVI